MAWMPYHKAGHTPSLSSLHLRPSAYSFLSARDKHFVGSVPSRLRFFGATILNTKIGLGLYELHPVEVIVHCIVKCPVCSYEICLDLLSYSKVGCIIRRTIVFFRVEENS